MQWSARDTAQTGHRGIENYADAERAPVAADGYRVYPPHSYTSVFVEASGVIGCGDADAGLLGVGPVQSEKP